MVCFKTLTILSCPSFMCLQLESKFARLVHLTHGNSTWSSELLAMSPQALGRCLASSHAVLDRLAFFTETGATPTGPKGRTTGLLRLLTMSLSAFKVMFPAFSVQGS